MDYQSLMTNQVVYIFRCKHPDDNTFPIEFFLAVMNSRAIYYYLVKTSGETEWRSHPYLTQNQILDLPLPHSHVGAKLTSEAISQIVTLTKPYLMEGAGLPPKADAEVEHLVARLYGLSKKHYEYIYDTLMDVEQLLPVKSLGAVSVNDIFE
jgi:adenine-specific DNA-methyltransferase